MLSKRFPFGIYYEMEDDVVYVYAILDLRRDPLWIWKQLRETTPTCERQLQTFREWKCLAVLICFLNRVNTNLSSDLTFAIGDWLRSSNHPVSVKAFCCHFL